MAEAKDIGIKSSQLEGAPLLFVGAGFSKGIFEKMPLLSDLSRLVLEKQNFSRWGIDNVEDLMSFLSSHMPWESLSEKHQKLEIYYSLIKEIGRIILDKSNEFTRNIKDQPDELKKITCQNKYYGLIFNWMNQASTIISLNYDTLIETLIGVQHLDLDLNGIYKTDFKKDGSKAMGRVMDKFPQLLKLHGSINWFYPSWGNENSQVYYTNPYLDNSNSNCEHINNSYYPFIIPPTFLKQDFIIHGQIMKIWSYAREAIRNHTDVITIGYSLPPSDIMIRNLFSGAVFPHCEKTKRKVYVVNPDKEVGERFKKLAGEKRDSLIEYCHDVDILFKNGIVTTPYND